MTHSTMIARRCRMIRWQPGFSFVIQGHGGGVEVDPGVSPTNSLKNKTVVI